LDTRLHITSTSKVTIRDAYAMSGRMEMQLVSSNMKASIKATKIKPSQKKTRTIKAKTATRLTLRRPMMSKMIKTKKLTNMATAIRKTPAKTMMAQKTIRT